MVNQAPHLLPSLTLFIIDTPFTIKLKLKDCYKIHHRILIKQQLPFEIMIDTFNFYKIIILYIKFSFLNTSTHVIRIQGC